MNEPSRDRHGWRFYQVHGNRLLSPFQAVELPPNGELADAFYFPNVVDIMGYVRLMHLHKMYGHSDELALTFGSVIGPVFLDTYPGWEDSRQSTRYHALAILAESKVLAARLRESYTIPVVYLTRMTPQSLRDVAAEHSVRSRAYTQPPGDPAETTAARPVHVSPAIGR